MYTGFLRHVKTALLYQLRLPNKHINTNVKKIDEKIKTI